MIQKIGIPIFCLIQGIVGLYAQNKCISNLEFLNQMIDSVSAEFGADLQSGQSPFKLNIEPGITPAAGYVLNHLTEQFQKSGLFQTGESDSLLPVLHVGIEKVAVWYDDWCSQPIWGKGSLKRCGELSVHFCLTSAAGQYLWQKKIEQTVSDVLSGENIKLAERGDQILGEIPLPSGHGLKRWVEPVVAMGTTSVVVLLFYIIRSR